MTISEAQKAARNNTPVIYEHPMLGPLLYARIKNIGKSFALLSEVARGKEAEIYYLELADMNPSGSIMVAKPELVRIATPEELKDIKYYKKGY